MQVFKVGDYIEPIAPRRKNVLAVIRKIGSGIFWLEMLSGETYTVDGTGWSPFALFASDGGVDRNWKLSAKGAEIKYNILKKIYKK